MISLEALDELREICPGVEMMTEGGQEFVYLPGLLIRVGTTPVARDALLTLQPHSGYASRLFLSEPIAGHGKNWTSHTVLGRVWHSPSWKNVPSGRPVEMLLQHLKVYR